MLHRMFAAVVTAALCVTIGCAATVTPPPQPQGAEVQFVTQMQHDLMARFPTAADAEKAGYFRYTNEDNTGAISYANLQWQSADPQHPSQLWYDAHGNLLGADFSVLQSNSPQAPSLWGVNPARWTKFTAHMHYVITSAGKISYRGGSIAKYKAAGGDPDHPTADAVVKLGMAHQAADVQKVFVFPAIWDLIVWVKTNPDGAFAEKNPLVKPSKPSTMPDGM